MTNELILARGEPKHGVRMQAGRPPRSMMATFLAATTIKSYVPDPNDTRKLGFDLSHFEPDMDLRLVHSYVPNVELCIFRICGSYTVKDTMFPTFWPWAGRIGLPRAMYMYNWPGWSIDRHIANFMDSLEKHCPNNDLGVGAIWVDAECHAGKSKREVSDHTWGCISRLAQETGMRVGWYTGPWFKRSYMEYQDWMDNTYVWEAQWYSDQAREHPGPVDNVFNTPEKYRVWHQTGSRGRANEFGGTSYYDTDRWQRGAAAFNTFHDVTPDPSEPPAPDYGTRIAALETRTNDLERWQHHNLSYEA